MKQDKRPLKKHIGQKRIGQNTPIQNEACVADLRAFAQGGCAGVHRLNQVVSNVFAYHGVDTLDMQLRLAFRAGLSVFKAQNPLRFMEVECKDQSPESW